MLTQVVYYRSCFQLCDRKRNTEPDSFLYGVCVSVRIYNTLNRERKLMSAFAYMNVHKNQCINGMVCTACV